MPAAVYYQGNPLEPLIHAMPAIPSEDEFLDRVNRGNPSVAAELDCRYRQRLCGLVQAAMDGNIRRREDPEDVVQTVLRTYFRRAALGEFHIADSSDLWALLAKITRRKILKRVEYHHAAKRDSPPSRPCPSIGRVVVIPSPRMRRWRLNLWKRPCKGWNRVQPRSSSGGWQAARRKRLPRNWLAPVPRCDCS